jgi:hypothetical protein
MRQALVQVGQPRPLPPVALGGEIDNLDTVGGAVQVGLAEAELAGGAATAVVGIQVGKAATELGR